MKKTLIAIAALAATGAFAQSTVTINGTLDMGYLNKKTQASATADTSVSTFAMNNTATSAVNISIVEDLGGGLRAAGFLETNPQVNGAGTSSDGTLLAGGGTVNGDSTATFANGQRFVGISNTNSWGGLRMGAPNSAVLSAAASTAQPFGTAMGGGYSTTFSVTGNGAGMRDIRSANSARYDSPVFSGFSFNYALAFNNKDAAGTTNVTTGVNVLGLNYTAGPLNVAYANGAYKNGAGAANTNTNVSTLSANYTFGTTTVYAGIHNAKLELNSVETGKTSAMNFAVKHVMGNIALMANTVSRKDKLSATNPADGSLLGLGLDYSLSKRTTAYARYEAYDTNKASDAAGKRTAYAAGVKHTF
jgi:predicted porin